MKIPFARSPRSSVGIEWEIQLVDRDNGDLRQAAQAVLEIASDGRGRAAAGLVQEFLANTIEIVSDPFQTVGEAVAQVHQRLEHLRQAAAPLRIDLLGAGSHPFAHWENQDVTAKERYQELVERTGWWGRQMVIFGAHTHIGVEEQRKVLPLIKALLCYVPHLQALSASSPFWAGTATGYASNRALMFQQLPTAGLPIQFDQWEQVEDYVRDMTRTRTISEFNEIRWDIRPAPHFGTIEVRVCDSPPTLEEVAGITALIQCLVEEFSSRLDRGVDLPSMPTWFVQENKWRAARYGMEAVIILNAAGDEEPLKEHLLRVLTALVPTADRLGCLPELASIHRIIHYGASYQRQLQVDDAADGDLTAVVKALIHETETGTIGPALPGRKAKPGRTASS
ncbi:MAG: glutamate--cysteine ligase [Bifidobacteriaceae bacterium]|jgi:carboxylate-amine ligase|nr:glutamate--cysteine ligase [Bifidobacteriaceae bacterium]